METDLPQVPQTNAEIPHWLDPVRKQAIIASQRHCDLRQLLADWAAPSNELKANNDSPEKDSTNE